MAKKKSDTPTDILGSSPSTGVPNAMPVQQVAMPMGMPEPMPGNPMAGNPMFAMMQMMQTMMAGGVAPMGMGGPVAFVIAEEGFYNPPEFGRDDLCSRMTKIGMKATGLGEEEFAQKVLSNVFVIQSQYHRGKSWDDFVGKYRYLVEKENIRFVVIDSLNMLDPTRNRTADNLSALKTYNHEKGYYLFVHRPNSRHGYAGGRRSVDAHRGRSLFGRGDEPRL